MNNQMKDTPKKKGTSPLLSLKDSERRYRRLFETAQDGILILDAETGMITDVNPFLINMLGYSREEFLDKKLWEVGAFTDIKANKRSFLALQEKAYIRYKDLPLKTKTGELIPVEFVSNVYEVDNENVIQCNIRNIKDRKQDQEILKKSEANLREISVRDHLTGLFNRRYMEETLERELARALRKQVPVGIIMLDVDDFKQFNDTYGHAAGDKVLYELGSLLLNDIRQDDVPCRYGGDEFIVVMPDASREVTQNRANLIKDYACNLHIQFEGQTLKEVSLSAGVAIFPEDGTNIIDILRVVDKKLYEAKDNRGRK